MNSFCVRACTLRPSREVHISPGRKRDLLEYGRRGEPDRKGLRDKLSANAVEDDLRPGVNEIISLKETRVASRMNFYECSACIINSLKSRQKHVRRVNVCVQSGYRTRLRPANNFENNELIASKIYPTVYTITLRRQSLEA